MPQLSPCICQMTASDVLLLFRWRGFFSHSWRKRPCRTCAVYTLLCLGRSLRLSGCLSVCHVLACSLHSTWLKLFSTSSRIDTSGIRIPGQQDRPAVRLRARQRLGCNPAQAVRSLVSIGSVPRRPQEQNYDQSQQAKPTTNHRRRRHHDHGLGPTATTTF